MPFKVFTTALARRSRRCFFRWLLHPRLTAIYDRWAPLESLGERGEREAERHLLRLGYRILYRRFSDRMGELDLIAVDGKIVVFVEVKTWQGHLPDDPSQAVHEQKQLRMTRTALHFLRQHDLLENPSRFDVISIIWSRPDQRPELRHFVNAFEPVGKFQFHR